MWQVLSTIYIPPESSVYYILCVLYTYIYYYILQLIMYDIYI